MSDEDDAIRCVEVAHRQMLSAIRQMQAGVESGLGGEAAQAWQRHFDAGYAMAKAECAALVGHALNNLSREIAKRGP